ncbi:MAG: TlpA disulfide reductase family protein [Mycobacteriales bacterium]
MSTRRQVMSMLAVLALVGAVLLVRGGSATQDRAPAGDLTALRVAANLASCPPGIGRELPALTLPCLAGGDPVRLAAAGSGRPTLVTIWATWCPPCVREVPLLQAFAERAAGAVEVVGVLHEDLPANALEFARQYGMRYPSVVDGDGQVLRAFGSGPPITVLLRADGAVAAVKRGEFTDLAQIVALVKDSLGVQT